MRTRPSGLYDCALRVIAFYILGLGGGSSVSKWAPHILFDLSFSFYE